MNPLRMRFLFLATILILALCFLPACGGSQQAGTPAPAPPPAPEKEQTIADKDAVIELIEKGTQINEMSYDMVMIGPGLSSESKVWFKGEKMKTDTMMNGQRVMTIFDLTKGELISYIPGENTGFKMKTVEYQGLDNITPIDYTKGLDKDAFIFVGTEKVNGMECMVIQIASGTSMFKQWISVDYGVVVKAEESYEGQNIVLEFKNLKVGSGSVADDIFNLPQGLEIMDMNQMMQFNQQQT